MNAVNTNKTFKAGSRVKYKMHSCSDYSYLATVVETTKNGIWLIEDESNDRILIDPGNIYPIC